MSRTLEHIIDHKNEERLDLLTMKSERLIYTLDLSRGIGFTLATSTAI